MKEDQEQQNQETAIVTSTTVPETDPAAEAGEAIAAEPESAAAPVEETLRQELTRVREENQALQNRFLRSAADLENLKRRTDRERQDAVKFANKQLFLQLLGV